MSEKDSVPKKNKIRSVSLTVANVLVFLIAWGAGRTYPLAACIFAAIYFSILLGFTFNKLKTAKESGGDVSKIKRELNGYVAWVALLAVLLGFQVWSVGGFNPTTTATNQTPEQLASQAVEGLNSSTTYPYELDEVTTATGTTSEGNTIKYQYIIHDADTSNITDVALRNTVQPSVCSDTSTKALLDRGVNMQYTYTVKETGQELSFTVTQSDC